MVAIEIEEMYKIVGCTPVNIIKDRGYWWTVGLFETVLFASVLLDIFY